MLAVWAPLLLLVAAADAGTADRAPARAEAPAQRQALADLIRHWAPASKKKSRPTQQESQK